MRRELSVCELSPGEFTARVDQLIRVYAAAMRPPADMLPGRRSIMIGHAAYPGFRALTAAENGTRFLQKILTVPSIPVEETTTQEPLAGL